jgi:hypothetical protein
MAPLAASRQTLDVAAGQAFDARSPLGCRFSFRSASRNGFLRLDGAGQPHLRLALNGVVFVLLACFLKVVFQLLLGVPPALPDGPHLLGTGCRVRMLVGTKIARAPSAYIAHKGIVPLGGHLRKGSVKPHSPSSRRIRRVH